MGVLLKIKFGLSNLKQNVDFLFGWNKVFQVDPTECLWGGFMITSKKNLFLFFLFKTKKSPSTC